MNKLIKAERYRLLHSGNFFKFLVFLCVLVAFTPFFADHTCYQKTLFENIDTMGMALSMFLPMLVCMVISVIIGNSYSNRTAYYEIMDENSIFNMVLSKVIVYSTTVVLTFGVPMSLYFVYIGAVNGIGEIHNIALFAILFAVITLHYVMSCVLTTMCVKNVIAAAIIPYIRYVILGGLGVSIFSGNDKADKILSWFASRQIANLGQLEYSWYFIFAVLASYILEFGLLYFVVHRVYRNKNFK